MRTTLFATAALLGFAFGQAFASEPVRTASEATGVETNYRTASEATGVETSYRVASWDKFDESDHTRRAEPGENTADGVGANQVNANDAVAQAEQTGVNNGAVA